MKTTAFKRGAQAPLNYRKGVYPMSVFSAYTCITAMKYKNVLARVTDEEAAKITAVFDEIHDQEIPTQYFAQLVYFNPVRVLCRWYDEFDLGGGDDGGEVF